MIVRILLLALLAVAGPASAQQFPALSGRVVDQADLLPPADEAALTARLEALQQASTRQLVVATVNGLDGLEIEDYGYRLGRHWGIGQNEANNGVILLVAPIERKVRIEVGYGLEPIVTDAVSSLIINNQILPAFKGGDYRGGIVTGADALIAQLQAPPEVAEAKALEAARAQQRQRRSDSGGSIFPLIFWGVIIFFFILPRFTRGRRGRRYGPGGIFLWGPGLGGGSWGGGSRGGGFGGFSGGGGGGFSGGGGSFGGGGASGGW